MYYAIGIIVLLLIVFVAIYNKLARQKNQVENAFSQIDTQLQRRYDLIPNLVETVKGYATHEKEVFERVTAARNLTANAKTVEEKAVAAEQLGAGVMSIMAVAENYPELKASSNFQELQVELTNTENKIAFSRQFYNDSVNKFNDAIVVFPQNMVAGMLGYGKMEYFKTTTPAAQEAVKVQF